MDTFEEYKIDEKDAKKGPASVKVYLGKFWKETEDPQHTADAELENGNLKITADLNGQQYKHVVENVDIHPTTKVTRHKGYFVVKVTKMSDFSLAAKFSE